MSAQQTKFAIIERWSDHIARVNEVEDIKFQIMMRDRLNRQQACAAIVNENLADSAAAAAAAVRHNTP